MELQHSDPTPQAPPAYLLAAETASRQITPYHRDPALVAFFPWVYEGLSLRVGNHLQSDEPLDTAEIVHGLFDDGVARGILRPVDRAYVLAVSALAMRQVLVSGAQRRTPADTAGPRGPVRQDVLQGAVYGSDVMAVHGALQTLANYKVEWVGCVECRYFAGLSMADTALALNIPVRRIAVAWPKISRWMQRFLALTSTGP